MPTTFVAYICKEDNYSGTYSYILLDTYIMEDQAKLKERNILRKIGGAIYLKRTIEEWFHDVGKEGKRYVAMFDSRYRLRLEIWETQHKSKRKYINTMPDGKYLAEIKLS